MSPEQDFPPPETLDFLFEFVKDAPTTQLANVDSLDGKLVQLFSFASVVIGLAAAGGHVHGTASGVLLIIAVAVYGVVSGACGFGLWPRSFRLIRHTDVLWARYWADDVRSIKHALVAEAAQSYAANKEPLKWKARAVVVALIATGVEVVLVGVTLILTAFA